MNKFTFRKIDDDTDYMAKRNEAAARGDFGAAEGYERDRNYKIDKLGLNYPKTYDYIDVGNEIKTGMQNGAPGAYIKELDDYRVNKANTNPGLSQFSGDEIHDAAMRYHFNDLMGVGGQFQNRPVYEDKYGAKVDELFDRVMNGKEFSYDMESDPNYQAYKDMYTREGQRAMQDTLAQVAQNAGGNNSYAVSAAAQANNYYMQQLADKVPELFNAAYNRYMNEENLKRQDLEIARMLETDDYNRYLNDMNVFQTNVGLADSLVNGQLDREYRSNRDRIADERYLDERDYNRQVYEDETAYNRAEADENKAFELAMTMIQNGYMPSEEALAAAGIGTDSDTWKAIANWNMYERMGGMPMTGMFGMPAALGANGMSSMFFDGMIPSEQLGIQETENPEGEFDTQMGLMYPGLYDDTTPAVLPMYGMPINGYAGIVDSLVQSARKNRSDKKPPTPGQMAKVTQRSGGSGSSYSGGSVKQASGKTGLDGLVNKLNSETQSKYGKPVISYDKNTGKYTVDPAAREMVVYEIANNDGISAEDGFEYLKQLGLPQSVVDVVEKDNHYWR